MHSLVLWEVMQLLSKANTLDRASELPMLVSINSNYHWQHDACAFVSLRGVLNGLVE